MRRHRRPPQPQPFLLDQLVGEVLIVEALGAPTQTQLRHPYPNLLRHSMGRARARGCPPPRPLAPAGLLAPAPAAAAAPISP